VELNQMGEEIYPQGLEATIREAWKVADVPILVTENGLATQDDTQRVAYLKTAVAGVRDCLADGIDIRGYTAWTAFDNFEWIFGYRSAHWLGGLARTNGADLPRPTVAG
jgi:beta-glucosidase